MTQSSARHVALLVVLLVIALGAHVAGADQYAGTAAFLELGHGARSLALGGAFTGVAEGVHALFFNPAGLGSTASQLSSIAELSSDFYNHGSIAAMLGPFGMSVGFVALEPVTERDEHGASLGTLDYSDFAVSLGSRLCRGSLSMLGVGVWSIGSSAKVVRMGNLGDGGDGLGANLDVSALLCGSAGGGYALSYKVGLTVRNVLGGAIRYRSGHEEAWSREATLGISVSLRQQLLVALDFSIPEGAGMGVEWSPVDEMRLRVGVRSEGGISLSGGFGVDAGCFGVEYACVFKKHLGCRHRVELLVHLDSLLSR